MGGDILAKSCSSFLLIACKMRFVSSSLIVSTVDSPQFFPGITYVNFAQYARCKDSFGYTCGCLCGSCNCFTSCFVEWTHFWFLSNSVDIIDIMISVRLSLVHSQSGRFCCSLFQWAILFFTAQPVVSYFAYLCILCTVHIFCLLRDIQWPSQKLHHLPFGLRTAETGYGLGCVHSVIGPFKAFKDWIVDWYDLSSNR